MCYLTANLTKIGLLKYRQVAFIPLSVLTIVRLYVYLWVSSLGKGEQSYPDLLALLIALLVTVIVALGVKNSVGFNNALNVINLIVWVFMMIAGLFFVNGENWDEGRFLPFGWSGVCIDLQMCIHAKFKQASMVYCL